MHVLHGRLRYLGEPGGPLFSSVSTVGLASTERTHHRRYSDCPARILFVFHRAEYSGTDQFVRECRSDTVRAVVPDKLGRGNVLCAYENARQSENYNVKRGTGSDRVYILRQNWHINAKYNDFQQVLRGGQMLWRYHR